MTKHPVFLLLALTLAFGLAASADDEIEGVAYTERAIVSLPSIKNPPVIDGSGGDSAWRSARKFELAPPGAKRPKDSGVVARVCRDGKSIYVLFEITDPDAAGTPRKTDEAGWDPATTKSVELLIDSSADARTYHRLAVGQHNDRLAVKYLDGGRLATHGWSPEWESQTARTKDGWSVELAAPWTSVGRAPTGGTFMGINLLAHLPGGEGLISWQGTEETMRHPAAFGLVVFGADYDEDAPRLTIEDLIVTEAACSVALSARGRAFPSTNFAFFYRLTLPGLSPVQSLSAMDVRYNKKSELEVGPVRIARPGPASLIIAAKRKSEIINIRAITFMVGGRAE